MSDKISNDLTAISQDLLALLLCNSSAENPIIYVGEPGNPSLLDALLSSPKRKRENSSVSSSSFDSENNEETCKKKLRKMTLNNNDDSVAVRIGDNYQVDLNKIAEENVPMAEDKLLWDPKIDFQTVEDYLKIATNLSTDDIPHGTHLRDDEYALNTLFKFDYNTELALDYLKKNPPQNHKQWSEMDCRNFEESFLRYGKNFQRIREKKFLEKTVGEMVEFYYLWKKTERFDIFLTSRMKRVKEKYAIEPGVNKEVQKFCKL